MSRVDSDHSAESASFEGKKHALVIGVDTSPSAPGLAPLKYAETDARGMGWLLSREESNFAFPSPVLVGEDATTQNVRQAVIHLIEQRNQEDLLLFYFLGHGYPLHNSNGDVEIYLVTADFDPEVAKLDPSAYLSLRWLRQRFFESNETASVLIILDCVYAGNIGHITETPSFQLSRLLQEYFTTLQQSEQSQKQPDRSWAILTSAQTGAEAYEQGDGHTRMTYFILNALGGTDREALDSDGNISLVSLYTYLAKQTALTDSQRPALLGQLGRRWVLASHPAQNPVKISLQDFVSQAENQQEAIVDLEQQFFDMTICQKATFAHLDIEQIRVFLQKERVLLQDDYRADLNEQAQFEELSLLQGAHPTYGALLCFGRHPSRDVAGAYMRCIDWKGTDRKSGWREEKEHRGGLLQQFVEGCNFLQKNLRFGRVIEPGGSSEQPEIPFRVLEEALANALVHREYITELDHRFRSEGIQLEIFSDRVEISSPGQPPFPVSVTSLMQASQEHPGSHPRNPQIMRIFYLAGYVEKVGSGIERIQRLMKDAHLLPPRIDLNEQSQILAIVLPRRIQTAQLLALNGPEKSTVANGKEMPRSQALALMSSDENRTVVPPGVRSQSVTSKKAIGHRGQLIFALLCLVLIGGVVLGLGWRSGVFPRGNELNPTSPLPAASTTIQIASDFPTSGLDTLNGLPLQNAVQMAITEANNNKLLPGYTLQLVPYDDVGIGNIHDPAKGTANVTNAVANNLIAVIIGPGNSSVAIKELPVANRASIALISPTTTYPCLTKDSSADPDCSEAYEIKAQMQPTGQLTFFRLATTEDRQGKADADYLFKTKRYHKVVLLRDDSDVYSFGLAQSFAREWQQLDGQILSLDLQQSSVQSYRNALQTVASTQPDLIYFSGTDPNGTYALQALANIPQLQKVTFAGGDGIIDSGFAQAADNLHLSAPVYASLPIPDPAHSGTTIGQNFQDDFIANGYSNYLAYAASAYDCTMLLIQAIRTALHKGVSTPHGANDKAGARLFRLAILQALAHNEYTDQTGTHHSYTGATGKQSFDANGDTTNHTISFYQLNTSAGQASWIWLQQANA